MFNNKKLKNLQKEYDDLKEKNENEKRQETIKQHYCKTCENGIQYWETGYFGDGYYTYLCALENPCSNYVKKDIEVTETDK